MSNSEILKCNPGGALVTWGKQSTITAALSSRRLGTGQMTRPVRSPTHRWPGGDCGVVRTRGPGEALRQPVAKKMPNPNGNGMAESLNTDSVD